MKQQSHDNVKNFSRPAATGSHGGDIYSAENNLGIDRSKLLDFSANIMPTEIDENIKSAICAAIDNCRYYPDPLQRRLRQALAAHHDLEPDQIVCGNGAADLIFRTVHALRPSRAYLPVPSFSEYERALHESGCEIKHWLLNTATGFRIDDNMLNWLREMESESTKSSTDKNNESGCRMLILCQPNNPTGLLIEPDILAKVIDLCAELSIYLFIDECFLDFLGPVRGASYSSMVRLKKPYREELKLILLRSMTKYYSLPGLRAGYICTSSELAGLIIASGQPWSVSTLTEAAVLAILSRERRSQLELADQVELWLSQERPMLEQALRDRGFIVFPGAANFIFFRAQNCPDLADQLMQKGIIIRSCADYVGLDQDYFRIAILNADENSRLISVLNNVRVLSY